MATPPETERPPAGDDKSVGELVIDISEKTSVLIREEIELAKAEISEKVTKIVTGGAVALAAATFLFLFVLMFVHGIALLLTELFFGDNTWIGYLVEAAFWLLVAVAAGLFAYRAIRSGSPPTPDMAIEEAKLTKETFEGSDS